MNTARNTRTEYNVKLLFGTNGLPVIVFDTETTGTDPETDRIIQLSAMKFVIENHKLKETDSLNLYLNPEMTMSDKVIKIHGITNEFVAEQPTEKEAFGKIRDFFGPYPIVCGHNIGFDNKFMAGMYRRCGEVYMPRVSIDTVDCARDNIPYTDVPDYKLETLTQTLGFDTGLTFHNAMDDVKAASLLLEAMYNEYILPERKTGPHCNKIKIKFIQFRNGYNSEQRGIWVWSYDDEKMWYSNRRKCWMSGSTDLSYVDIDDLETKVLKMLGADLEEMGKMTEETFLKKCKPGRRSISWYQTQS